MHRFTCLSVALLFAASAALAETATVNVNTEDVESADAVLTIETALPVGVVGKRISRAILDVPIVVGESLVEGFNSFPIVEVFEDGSELPKQTVLLRPSHAGVVRIDVTRFVREWSNTDARSFVVGAVSESNDTDIELGSVGSWPSGVKARLTITYQDRDGTSVASQAH